MSTIDSEQSGKGKAIRVVVWDNGMGYSSHELHFIEIASDEEENIALDLAVTFSELYPYQGRSKIVARGEMIFRPGGITPRSFEDWALSDLFWQHGAEQGWRGRLADRCNHGDFPSDFPAHLAAWLDSAHAAREARLAAEREAKRAAAPRRGGPDGVPF